LRTEGGDEVVILGKKNVQKRGKENNTNVTREGEHCPGGGGMSDAIRRGPDAKRKRDKKKTPQVEEKGLVVKKKGS